MADVAPPKQPVFFKLPDGYWDWTEEQQRAWARETAEATAAKLKPRSNESSET